MTTSLATDRPTNGAAEWRAACLDALAAIERGAIHRKIATMIDYYRSIMPPDRLPGRQHFEPMAIPLLLPNIWLVEVLDGPTPRFRYRLMGTRVAQAFSADVTGRLLDDVHPGFAGNPMHGHLTGVVTTRRPTYRRGTPNAWPIDELQSLERIFLPLAADGATVDIVLALTVFIRRDGGEL